LLVFSCEAGWEQILSEELTRVFDHCCPRQVDDGFVSVEVGSIKAPAVPAVAFASQCVPIAMTIDAESISDWVRIAAPRIIASLSDHVGPWRLHIFGATEPHGKVARRRAQLIENGIIEFLRKKQRRLIRTLSPGDRTFADCEAFAQVALVTPEFGYSSICLPELRHALRRCISPFPGGIVEVPPDRKAPSRAFAKLAEAELRLGCRIAPGETCVDLGSSPGSWSYVALNRGAQVVAVDRSPLRADLMKHPNLTFVRGDAFRFAPPAPVDWLLCDVIAFPDRILELLRRWLTERWCRKFCATIKFRGRDEYAKLESFKTMLAESGAEFQLRRLNSNKNEVTATGIGDWGLGTGRCARGRET
jgi:23S rRNA (cytidine2498-2'-O)-methyltransferase